MDEDQRAALEATTRYDPARVEERVFAEWLESGHFSPSGAGESYSVAIPPPNVTGSLHMGHALNGAIQDALIRMRRMQGRNTLWILGTDHAGIATQAVVEKQLREEGTDRHELGREAFVERVWEWKRDYGERIVEQFKRLGASCDYGRERFTLDEGYVRAVYRAFKRFHDKGYIYRDHYMVNWDPGSRSAISDLEVENREVTDMLVEIDYPLDSGDGAITVATVRPETMLGDVAVCVHPDDERYEALVGKHCILPIVGRRLPIIADDYIDPEFGTGVLKITPGHDINDFEIGRRHGLDEPVVIGPDGRMSEEAGEPFAGMTIGEAQQAVMSRLREQGLIRSEQAYTHSVPFSHRSGERIEPLISLQWFCRMDELARPAIEAVRSDRVRIVPEQWKRVYLEWMENIRPWCISRQLWWGHRLPVFYCDACEEVYVAEQPPERCGACDGELRQDPDVLDTWFSSALWPFATLGWPDDDAPDLKSFYPTTFLTTARDILYLWVARMIMCGIEFTGEVPFDDVYVHSVIQARDGRRMSKSLGTGIDPLEEIDVHGADALRFGLLAMSSTQDVRYSDARVEQGRDLANKMWNASRLILLGAGDATPRPAGEEPEDLWIRSRLRGAITEVATRIDAYDFANATAELYRFFWSELCDWYLEIVKPRLYDGEPEVAANLLWLLERVLALAHPIIPFVTEEVWSYLPDRDGPLLAARFPDAGEIAAEPGDERVAEAGIAAVRAVRRWRELAGAPVGAVLPARLADGLPRFVATLARLEPASAGDAGEVIATLDAVEILDSEHVDTASARRRIGERLSEVEAEVKRAEGKLNNESFVSRAPAEVVEAERRKLESYRGEYDELAALVR